MLVTLFLFVRNKLVRTGDFLPLFSQEISMHHCPCLATSQPLLYPVKFLSTLIIAPAHTQASILPCKKPHERIMSNKRKQGKVGYHRRHSDSRMKAFPTDQPTN